jgi:primosomal replication protein N
MFNRVILMGQVISNMNKSERDGVVYADFILESKRRYGEEHKKIETIMIKVLTWGYNAKLCLEKLKKGSYVLVEGGLKFDEEDRIYYIGAWNVCFLDRVMGEEVGISGSKGNNKASADNTSQDKVKA